VIMPQKAAYTFHQFLFGIDGMEELGPREWIARKKAFIEYLSAAKGTTGNIPGKVKELDALTCRGRVGGEVLFDLRGQRGMEVRLTRANHEAAGAQELQDFHHLRIGRHEQVSGDFYRHLRRTHDAPFIALGISFSRAQTGLHELRVHHEFPQTLLGMGEMAVPEHMRHEQGSPQDQFTLRHIFGCTLMRRMVGRVRGRGSGVDHADITKQKYTLPWNQHIIEEDYSVHLLEARAEGMLEVRLPD